MKRLLVLLSIIKTFLLNEELQHNISQDKNYDITWNNFTAIIMQKNLGIMGDYRLNMSKYRFGLLLKTGQSFQIVS